ncbi:MAG: sensor histidine kinase [Saprospiraceae bacterium]|nr:sensor histidine kinase [Saprospiraceae bacterium]
MRNIRITILVYWIIAFFVTNTTCQTQPISIEEAIDQIEKIEFPAEKCEFALKTSHTYFMHMQRENSLQIAQLGLKVAQNNNLDTFDIPLLINIGRIYESTNQLDSAIYYAEMARQKINSETDHFKGKVYTFLGRHYQYYGKLDSMHKYYQLAEDWNTKHEPYRNWVLYEQWHKLYIETGDFVKAKELLDKAYSLTQPVGKRMDHGMLLYRFRSLASRIGDMDMYAQYSKEYHELVNDGSNKSISAHGFDLGENLSIKDQIKTYEKLFESNKKIAFELGNTTYFPKFTELLLEDGQLNKAKKYWMKIDTANQPLQFISDFEGLGVQIYEGLNNYPQAYSHLKKKNMLDDQLQNKEKLKQVEEFNVKYETVEKEKQMALLASQNELKNIELSKARQSRIVLGIGLLIASFFAFGLGYLYVQNKKRKQQLEINNDIIAKALDDKNILLREIHHRVKNNLQVVSSLLNLQSNFISDDTALEAINDGKNRVSSMALIHQNLYQEENLTSINCKEYFDDLIENLFDSYNIQEENISLVKDINDLDIDVDTMIPMGLIVNELVTNSLKHAFNTPKNIGQIKVSLKEHENVLKLSVSDNGSGVSEEKFLTSNSFGNRMIKAFLQKLDADISVQERDGTIVTLTIKNYKRIAA